MEVKKEKTTKNVLGDILHSVKWSHISTQYFGKSRSWFSQRLNGYDGNGTESDFSQEEREVLKNALLDVAEQIHKTAEKL